MQSRFVNEYRFEDGGRIQGDYKFQKNSSIQLASGVLKGGGEQTIKFDDAIQLSGDTQIKSGDTVLSVKEAGLEMSGLVTMFDSVTLGDLGKPVTVLGNLHIDGQITAGNLEVSSQILPADVAFDSVQVE